MLVRLKAIFESSNVNRLLFYKPQFWSFLKAYFSEWDYYSRVPYYERSLVSNLNKELKDVEQARYISNFLFKRKRTPRKIKVKLVRSGFRKIRRRPFFNRRYTLPERNVYCLMIDRRAKYRYNANFFRRSRRTLNMKVNKKKSFIYKRKFLFRETRKLKYFKKSLKYFKDFLDSQNLSTSEKKVVYTAALSSMVSLRVKRKSNKLDKKHHSSHSFLSKINKHLLISSYNFSLDFNSLKQFDIPALQVMPESEYLFTPDAAFGQPHNLRALSNPDFFWDEWDTSFVRQQNGLSQENDLYEDDYFGEERFFSPSIPAEHTDDSLATKDDSTDLILQTDTHLEWRFHPDRYREPHRKFRFRPLSAKRTADFDYFYPPDNVELSKIYREFPDWFLVPGLHNNQGAQDEIIVGDGPSNYNPVSPDNADTIFRPEFNLQHDITDPFDSTILYDWYTLQRVQSAFSERHPNVRKNTFKEYFSLPYAASILNCEDYFYRRMYKDHKRLLIGKGIDHIDFDGEHYFWDISVELPELSNEYISKEKLKSTADHFVDSAIINSLGLSSRKSNWRERISRNPILKFSNSLFEDFRKDDIDSEFFKNTGIKRSRAFFYDERALNKKFNRSKDIFYGVSRFSWLTEVFTIIVLMIVSGHLLFKYFIHDNIDTLFYGTPFFQFWDDSGLPSIARSRLSFPSHSRYGGFFAEKLKILKKVYAKYDALDMYRYNVKMKKRVRPSYVPTNYLHAFFTGPPNRYSDNFEVFETELNRIMFGQRYSPYRLIDRFYNGVTKLGSRQKSPRVKIDRAIFLNTPSLILEPELTDPYLDVSKSKNKKNIFRSINDTHSRFVKRFSINRESILGDIFYRKQYLRGNKLIAKHSSIHAFNLSTAVSGHYSLNTQYISFERPYSLDVSRHNFMSRTNRIFSLNRKVSDRYHTNWRPYDIFFSNARLTFNSSTKPPLTALIHEQNTSLSLSKLHSKGAKIRKSLAFLNNDKPNIWDETHTGKAADFNPKFLNILYVYWNRLYMVNWSRPKPFSYDSFLAGSFLQTESRPYFSTLRLPYTYFYFDNIEHITTTPRTKKLIPDYYRSDILDLIRAKTIKTNPMFIEDDEVFRDFRNLYRSSKPIMYDKLFSDPLNKDRLVLHRPISRIFPYTVWSTSFRYVNRELDYDPITGDDFMENYPLRSLSVSKGTQQFTIGSLRKPLYSNRNRLFKEFRIATDKRVRTTILPFSLDLFKVGDILKADSQPFIYKNTLPFIPVGKALSLDNISDLRVLRFFLLFDNMSNKFQSSEYNSVSGFKSFWFSKTRLDPVNKAHRTILQVGSNYQTSFLLNIPTFWETHYNSLWLENLADTYRTTSAKNLYDEDRRDYSYGQGQGLFYFISSAENFFIDQLSYVYNYFSKNLIFLRNLFFSLALFYICFSHRVILRRQFLNYNKFSSYSSSLQYSLANKSMNSKISLVKPLRRNSFNISLFRSLKKRHSSLQKQMILGVLPELYNSGGKQLEKLFLKRPKSFKGSVIGAARKVFSPNIVIHKKYESSKNISLTNFLPISNIGYSFLWSVHPLLIRDTSSSKRRQELYRLNYKRFYGKFSYRNYLKNQLKNQLYKHNNQNLFFEKRSLPYVSKNRSLFIQGHIFFISSNISHASALYQPDDRFNLEFYKPDFYNFDEFIFSKNKHLADPFSEQYAEKESMVEHFSVESYFQDDNFSKRRQAWSIARSKDRKSRVSYNDKIVNTSELQLFSKNLTRTEYQNELSSLNVDNSFFIEDLTHKRGIDELLSFNSGFIDPTLPYSQELSSRFTEETGPLLDLDEDDSDERVEDSIDHEVEPIDEVLPLNAESDDTEDHFESIFIELIHKFSSPETSTEVSVSSLLTGKTSRSLLERSVMSPSRLDVTYNIHSELINYSLWRLHSVENYTLDIPVVQLSLPTSDFDVPDEQIASKFYFNPTNFGMPTQYTTLFLVPYSLPRFMKRLDDISSTYTSDFNKSYSIFTSKYYDPTDPEGFDIKPFSWRSGISKDRPNRMSQQNKYTNLKEEVSQFGLSYSNLNSLSNLNFEKYSLNVGNSAISPDENEKFLQTLDPFAGDLKYTTGSSLLAEDFFNSMVEESSDNNLLDLNEMSHSVYSYNLEEEDEGSQLFETTSHYKWRFLSREYLLVLLNRPNEFEYTQLVPYTTTKDFNLSSDILNSENFNFNKFLISLNSGHYYSEFGLDADLVNDFIAHWPEQPQEVTEDFIIEFVFSELDLEGDGMPTPLFNQDVGDEDTDLIEDNEDQLQSSNPIFIEEDETLLFDISLELLLRDTDVANFSIENEDFRQDESLRVSSSSMFVSKASPSGFAVFPVRDPYEIRKKEGLDGYDREIKLSTVYRGKKSTEDPSFPFIDLDLADILIPVSQNKVTRIFEDNDQVVVSDTMDRVIGYLKPNVVKRAISDLLYFRSEIINKKLDTSLVDNVFSPTVNNKDLLNYLFLVQSPELTRAIARVKYGVIHELEQASLEELTDLEDYADQLEFLSKLERRFLKFDFERFKKSPLKWTPHSELYEREALKNDLIHQFDPFFNFLVRDTSSLKFFVISNLYFKTLSHTYDNVST
jgi:hypothetical protein